MSSITTRRTYYRTQCLSWIPSAQGIGPEGEDRPAVQVPQGYIHLDYPYFIEFNNGQLAGDYIPRAILDIKSSQNAAYGNYQIVLAGLEGTSETMSPFPVLSFSITDVTMYSEGHLGDPDYIIGFTPKAILPSYEIGGFIVHPDIKPIFYSNVPYSFELDFQNAQNVVVRFERITPYHHRITINPSGGFSRYLNDSFSWSNGGISVPPFVSNATCFTGSGMSGSDYVEGFSSCPQPNINNGFSSRVFVVKAAHLRDSPTAWGMNMSGENVKGKVAVIGKNTIAADYVGPLKIDESVVKPIGHTQYNSTFWYDPQYQLDWEYPSELLALYEAPETILDKCSDESVEKTLAEFDFGATEDIQATFLPYGVGVNEIAISGVIEEVKIVLEQLPPPIAPNNEGGYPSWPTAGQNSGWIYRYVLNGSTIAENLPMPSMIGELWEFTIPFFLEQIIAIQFIYIDPITEEETSFPPVQITPEELIEAPNFYIGPVITIPAYEPDFLPGFPPPIPNPDDPSVEFNPSLAGYFRDPNDFRCVALPCNVPYVYSHNSNDGALIQTMEGLLLTDEEGNYLIDEEDNVIIS